jgi:hypothetical protein
MAMLPDDCRQIDHDGRCCPSNRQCLGPADANAGVRWVIRAPPLTVTGHVAYDVRYHLMEESL